MRPQQGHKAAKTPHDRRVTDSQDDKPAPAAPKPPNEIPKPGMLPPETLPAEIDSKDLLAGRRMMTIRHGAERYRLQVTKSGKLILTK